MVPASAGDKVGWNDLEGFCARSMDCEKSTGSHTAAKIRIFLKDSEEIGRYADLVRIGRNASVVEGKS